MFLYIKRFSRKKFLVEVLLPYKWTEPELGQPLGLGLVTNPMGHFWSD